MVHLMVHGGWSCAWHISRGGLGAVDLAEGLVGLDVDGDADKDVDGHRKAMHLRVPKALCLTRVNSNLSETSDPSRKGSPVEANLYPQVVN